MADGDFLWSSNHINTVSYGTLFLFIKKNPTRLITLSSLAIMSYATDQSDLQSLQFPFDVPAFPPYNYNDFDPDGFLSSANAAVRSFRSTLP
jgi:hypothetical protein